MRVGIVAREGLEPAYALAGEIVNAVEAEVTEFAFDPDLAAYLKRSEVRESAQELVDWAELVVTLGGDGTLLGVGRLCERNSPQMLGVNFGTLGFLTEFPPEEAVAVCKKALRGELQSETRLLIATEVIRGGQSVFSSRAMNDVVIQKGARERLLDMDLYVEGKAISRLRADGLIIATPTGSTAYSLAAGGAIVHPSLEVLSVTPICPHSLTNRPLMLPLSLSFSVRIPPYEGELFVSLDGQESFTLETDDEIRVRRSACGVNLLGSNKIDYFGILSGKLNWGLPNKNQ